MDIPYTGRRSERALERFIADPLPHKPVLLVEGARQVGKTTLVEHVLAGSAKPTVRINLERDSLDRMAFDECRDFAAFQDLLLDRHGLRPNADQILFIDEAQESRTLGGFVRFMKEEWPRATVILSGSTLRRLFRPHTRYPVGRDRVGAWRAAAGRLETLAGGVGDRLHRQDRPGRGPGRVQGEPLSEPSAHARPDFLSALPRPAPRIHREPGAVRGNERGRCADRESACLSPGAPRECNAVSFWRPALRGP